jgi:preprotein translocase subunit YajC
VPLVLILLVFWLLIIRPQRRRQQQLTQTQSALGIGSEVMLTSGIFGRVASLENETIRLEIAPGTTVKVARQAVVRVVEPSLQPGPETGPDLAADGPAGPVDRMDPVDPVDPHRQPPTHPRDEETQ